MKFKFLLLGLLISIFMSAQNAFELINTKKQSSLLSLSTTSSLFRSTSTGLNLLFWLIPEFQKLSFSVLRIKSSNLEMWRR